MVDSLRMVEFYWNDGGVGGALKRQHLHMNHKSLALNHKIMFFSKAESLSFHIFCFWFLIYFVMNLKKKLFSSKQREAMGGLQYIKYTNDSSY